MIFIVTFLVSCSSDDGDSNPADSSGDNDSAPEVKYKEISVPDAMKNAANSGDVGAAIAVSYLQIANSLQSYVALLNPPQESTNLSKPSDVTEEWTWSQDGTSYTLVLDELETSFKYTLTVSGTFQGETYSDEVLMEASGSKTEANGELYFYEPGSSDPALYFNWDIQNNGTYVMTIESGQGTNQSSIDIISNTDGSGSMDVSESNGESWHVTWESDGTGAWIRYDEQGNVADEGSW